MSSPSQKTFNPELKQFPLKEKNSDMAAEILFNEFENKKNKIWHFKDNPKLKEIILEADEQPWIVKFDENQQLEKIKPQKIIQAMDQSKISQNGYRTLTTTSQDLPKEWLIKEIATTLEKGGYHSISSILQFLLSKLVENKVLNHEAPTIYLRISGDGRNIGKKIKHVMLTLAILNDQKNLSKPEKHYSISLFSGTEKYTFLKAALKPIHNEL
ncbi:18926_t:CDS:2 [Racocetra fulgida]|uniref:18926_t:CDS:1 n=1 Tax=Racocetra fulgida TaxID=60492 RepID=A0A9N8ZQR2_9GLOM|nr:18926_t:CDS:2 [Racocetra fulgida]